MSCTQLLLDYVTHYLTWTAVGVTLIIAGGLALVAAAGWLSPSAAPVERVVVVGEEFERIVARGVRVADPGPPSQRMQRFR